LFRIYQLGFGASSLGVSPVFPFPQAWGVRRLTLKEVQDASCRGFGGVPQSPLFPQDWGIKEVDKAFVKALDILSRLTTGECRGAKPLC